MKPAVCFCVLALLFALASAGPSKLAGGRGQNQRAEVKTNNYGIVGGRSTDIKNYPYTVAIFADYLRRLSGGGALLNKYWIVCSAYQLLGFEDADLTVRAGSNNAAHGGQLVSISKHIVHEKFSMDYPYDIALIKTSSPVKFGKEADAVKLAKSTPKAGRVAQVTGFGKYTNSSETVLNLKVADVQVLSQAECKKHHSALDTSFCADLEGVGPCYSDIGDPLVHNGHLIGIYIGGDTCNYHGLPEIYTDVSPLREWILETIKKNSNKDEMEGIFDDDDDSSDSDDDDSSDSDDDDSSDSDDDDSSHSDDDDDSGDDDDDSDDSDDDDVSNLMNNERRMATRN